jgi:hypothetical protein
VNGANPGGPPSRPGCRASPATPTVPPTSTAPPVSKPTMPVTATIVIGASEAGLATSHCLDHRAMDHAVLDRGRVAERWRSERCDSNRLRTSTRISRPPGWSYTPLPTARLPDGHRAHRLPPGPRRRLVRSGTRMEHGPLRHCEPGTLPGRDHDRDVAGHHHAFRRRHLAVRRPSDHGHPRHSCRARAPRRTTQPRTARTSRTRTQPSGRRRRLTDGRRVGSARPARQPTQDQPPLACRCTRAVKASEYGVRPLGEHRPPQPATRLPSDSSGSSLRFTNAPRRRRRPMTTQGVAPTHVWMTGSGTRSGSSGRFSPKISPSIL